jgi:PRTRC genetic system protein B
MCTSTTTIDIGSSFRYRLSNALLVYTGGCEGNSYSSANNSVPYVTLHSVTLDQNQTPVLDPGEPASLDFVRKLAEGLLPEMPIEILPENVLVRQPEQIVWWTPASLRPMYFSGSNLDKLEQLNGKKFPQPPLVFSVMNGILKIRALLANKRPTATTRLYVAPYWNVNEAGSVCLGSSRVPQTTDVGNLHLWEKGFFGSEFTHPSGAHRITKYPGGFTALWENMEGQKTFPGKYLVESKQNLALFVGAEDEED